MKITMNNTVMKKEHIAPCGMNCSLCRAFQRDRNRCPGCNGGDEGKPAYCISCRIKLCDRPVRPDGKFCCDCTQYPCPRLKQLDKRYRTKYGMSMIENLNAIKAAGIGKFVRGEIVKWTCGGCGRLLCVHMAECPECGRTNGFYPGAVHPKKSHG